MILLLTPLMIILSSSFLITAPKVEHQEIVVSISLLLIMFLIIDLPLAKDAQIICKCKQKDEATTLTSFEIFVIGYIFAHIGKPKKAQDNKIANDILKMLLLEKIAGKHYRKIIVVCDEQEEKKLKGSSALSESIRQFGIEIL